MNSIVLRLLRYKQNTRSVSPDVFIEVVTEKEVSSKRDKQEVCFDLYVVSLPASVAKRMQSGRMHRLTH